MTSLHILLSNDDGIHAPGLLAAYNHLKAAGHRITVVAPRGERSASSQAISVWKPFEVEEVFREEEFFGIAVDATPADCVKYALSQVMKDNLPDVVIGGINPGPNIGDAVFYSGTVGVAAEAAFYGVPGIAVSLGDRATEQEEFSGVAEFLVELLKEFDSLDFSERRFININGPKGTAADINGVVVTRAGTARFLDKFVQRESRNGKPEVWRNEGDRMELSRDEDDLDDRALERGHISVTPMHLDITDFQARANLALVLNKIDPRTNRHAPGDVTDRESHVEEVSPFPTGN